jgi:1-acyl-sn-glycerol-3-phosphate acyltransferase
VESSVPAPALCPPSASEFLGGVSSGALWRAPLPHLRRRAALRRVVRSTLLLGRPLIRELHNPEYALAGDPVIFALNHTTKLEALLVPALLIALRGGRPVHFLADWNFLLVPGLASILRVAEVIPVNRKPARPAFLNRFRARLCPDRPAHELARERLAVGSSVGIFPEGTATGLPDRLLTGHRGAAQLSLETGVPLLPVGIRHSVAPGRLRVGNLAPMSLHFGRPLVPPPGGRVPDRREIADWHAQLMGALALLAAKRWQRPSTKT